MNLTHTAKYKSVQQSDDEDSDSLPIPESRIPTWLYIGWGLAFAFALSTAYLFIRLLNTTHLEVTANNGSHSNGFMTEFPIAKPYIREKLTMFWGGPRWYDNGTAYKLHNPDEPMYVGPPSDEIDAAWEELLKGRYMQVSEEEAELTFGKPHGLHHHENGVGYLVGLDGLHTLHCVDQLRRALDRDYYFGKKTVMAFPDRGHRDHCLDHIRQQLMCHADLTPVPVIWYPGYGRSFVQSDVYHTCRDWNAIREFVSSRPMTHV
ncbi:hypothetical protein COCC4DRAFT_35178 [Bipolaris maydis ATCC 48331]|uniref:Uncharacterized protein n=2 Tax=Cochliobolus heterostrophus TaxID=5016 RepID=M2UTT0_COCH5|nr:uncharacterized protein COCC4DRAFT_35178 [Bipolaris maydis ATCC 48331]EMD91267.1 hypothetical protein COCHEDRAFT_1021363 [Bipolaris maydis C5]KAJ5027012.1 hypothetical protein J3E73DRAFT_300547 [Bipolaris maydis]ENH98675.1 hypothetical protein COCC4DRAFT_35178 [Bipolaris maydis ATCC 48331]KAJ5051307.1 hypothetical protein J3E74DRAFT_389856 [Bipolaris maydis]KAJ5059228.1 hypothetical protein J3E74DRAFT_356651 [Bipolaris maydis]